MFSWKGSKLRFYIKNIIWNYSFWIMCKRTYVDYSFLKKNPINGKTEKIIKRRFIGYTYKGKLYQDNPGMPIKSKDDWKHLKKKYTNKTY